jgi:hypothetical protein
MYIHTVYRPEDHVDYLEEWLSYHTKIGVKHFFLYDNGGGAGEAGQPNFSDFERKIHMMHSSDPSRTRYGYRVKYTPDQARLKELTYLHKYSVTKILWQPIIDGKIIYDHQSSIRHLLTQIDSGLCAFIDIDEFIIKKEEFKQSRMYQKIFEDYHNYNSIFDCKKWFSQIGIYKYASKCILDLTYLKNCFNDDKTYIVNMHFENLQLEESLSHFNHYNLNKVRYRRIEHEYKKIYPNFKIVSFNQALTHMENPFEKSIGYCK